MSDSLRVVVSVGRVDFSLLFPSAEARRAGQVETIPYYISSTEAPFGPSINLTVEFSDREPPAGAVAMPVAFGVSGASYVKVSDRWTVYSEFKFGPNRPDQLSVRLVTPTLLFLLSELGVAPVHASAIVRGDRALLFVGRSGCGKSTTASRIVAESRRTGGGWELFADDRVLLFGDGPDVLVFPSFEKPNPFHRLVGRVPESGVPETPPLVALCSPSVAVCDSLFFPRIETGGSSRIDRLSSASALASLQIASAGASERLTQLTSAGGPPAWSLTLGPLDDSLLNLVVER